MNITITNDAGSTIYEHGLGNNFVILRGQVYEVKQERYDVKVTLRVSTGKDRDGEWRDPLYCELRAKSWTAKEMTTVTVRCSYDINVWKKSDTEKVKFHRFRVWEVLDEAPPALPSDADVPFDL